MQPKWSLLPSSTVLPRRSWLLEPSWCKKRQKSPNQETGFFLTNSITVCLDILSISETVLFQIWYFYQLLMQIQIQNQINIFFFENQDPFIRRMEGSIIVNHHPEPIPEMPPSQDELENMVFNINKIFFQFFPTIFLVLEQMTCSKSKVNIFQNISYNPFDIIPENW